MAIAELERFLVEKHKHRNKDAKLPSFLVVTCIAAATGGLMFGYDIGIAGGVSQMDSFLQHFFPGAIRAKQQATEETNYCKFDSQMLTAFTSSVYVAAFVSSLVATSVTGALGTKASILIGASIFLVGALLDGFAVHILMLFLGRLLLGFGLGFINQAVPIYLSEIAPARLRGTFNGVYSLSIGVGVVSANLINYLAQRIDKWGWRLSLVLEALPAVIALVGALNLPDTPCSLVQRGMADEARTTLKRLHVTDDVEEELKDMVRAYEEDEIMGRGGLRRLFTKTKYMPQVTVVVALQLFQQLCGIGMVAFYAPLLFESVAFGSDASLLVSVMVGFTNLFSVVISVCVVDIFGRRKLLLQGCFQMFICLVTMAATMESKEGAKYNGAVLVVAVGVYVLGFGWSWGIVASIISSEIYALEVRSAGQGVGMGAQMLFTFAFAQVFSKMLCVMKDGLFLFYAGWVVVMAVFVYFLLPESKGVPLEDMGRLWKEHWFWGQMAFDEPTNTTILVDNALCCSP